MEGQLLDRLLRHPDVSVGDCKLLEDVPDRVSRRSLVITTLESKISPTQAGSKAVDYG